MHEPVGDGYPAGGTAWFSGGPFNGDSMPAELVPWAVFLPRTHGQATDGYIGPVRNNLSLRYIEQYDRYELNGLKGRDKHYTFKKGVL